MVEIHAAIRRDHEYQFLQRANELFKRISGNRYRLRVSPSVFHFEALYRRLFNGSMYRFHFIF